MLEDKQIVGVKYKNKCGDCFEGREYSYFASKYIQKGDIVIAPTAYGQQKALVTNINLPESKIEKFKDKVKMIEKKIEIKNNKEEGDVSLI